MVPSDFTSLRASPYARLARILVTPLKDSWVTPNHLTTVRLGVGTTVEEAEKLLILKTLEATNNNKTRAAEILAISLKTLHNKLKEYGNAAADAALVREE